MSFARIVEDDRSLAKVAPNIQYRVTTSTIDHPLAISIAVLSQLISSLEFLKNGHLLLAESKNIYSSKAILRVYLEHLLKSIAIFLTSLKGSNELAKGYNSLLICEVQSYIKGLQFANIRPEEVFDSAFYPLFGTGQSLTNKQVQQIESPFKVKSLVDAIKNELGDEDAAKFLVKIIPNYKELSGFVHGGPSAALINCHVTNQNAEQNLIRDAELVVSTFHSARRHLLFLVAEINPKFAAERDELDSAINSYYQSGI